MVLFCSGHRFCLEHGSSNFGSNTATHLVFVDVAFACLRIDIWLEVGVGGFHRSDCPNVRSASFE